MTSVTMTARAAAAGLVGALALTACGGGGDSKDDSSAHPSTSATASADSGGADGTGGTGGTGDSGGAGGASSAASALEGSWLATTDGKAVALVVTGKQAGLFSTGGSVCSGSAGTEGGKQVIHLTCGDGSKDRAEGTVTSADGSTLRVTWAGTIGEETYTKAEGGQLPSGLPTASLGS